MVGENALCLALRVEDRVLAGSVVIVPRAHRPTVFDLTEAEWAATGALLREVKDHLVRELAPDGFTLRWNCGAVGGQEVMHAHLHVIPRFADEPFAGRGLRSWLKSEANRRPPEVPP